MSERPVLVTIIGALNLVLGILVVLAAILVFAVGAMDIYNMGLDAKLIEEIEKLTQDMGMSWSTICNILGVLFLIPGLLSVAVGYGLLKGWRVMWWIGVILNGISVLGGIIIIAMSFAGGIWGTAAYDIILLVINAVILWYMFRPKVKEFFKI